VTHVRNQWTRYAGTYRCESNFALDLKTIRLNPFWKTTHPMGGIRTEREGLQAFTLRVSAQEGKNDGHFGIRRFAGPPSRRAVRLFGRHPFGSRRKKVAQVLTSGTAN
jgi:hypothetical protein